MLVALPGGKAVGTASTSSTPSTPRVLVPRSPMAERAGITPVVVPANLWVSPSLLRPLPIEHARPALRVVA